MRISPARSGATPTCWCIGSSRRILQARSATSSMPRWWRDRCRLRRIERAVAKTVRKCGQSRPSRRPVSKELETLWKARRRALQRQRAPRRRSLARRRGLAEVPVHARAPGRGVRRHGQCHHQLRACSSLLDALYVEGLVHITELGGEYLPLRRGAPGTARRAQSGARYGGGHARARAGQPGRPGQPASIDFPPGARWRDRCAGGAADAQARGERAPGVGKCQSRNWQSRAGAATAPARRRFARKAVARRRRAPLASRRAVPSRPRCARGREPAPDTDAPSALR